ncbi:chromosome-associated kinesin KIF4B [Podospora fimiseda]|uniref:Chromosome-associated kinesin KIF4B n=1 Tax=Podospora fimiseda TaxID=252190 RepID=A0AAN7H006_9PEZI|nr:chromosome-associated kinesin KIF4B [Podospora fimiseda]
MMTSPPASPGTVLSQRPLSAMVRPAPRSNSRMSMASKPGGGAGGSRASDEDTKTAVKVVVRVRPSLNPNDPGYDLIPQRFQRSMVHVQSPTSLLVDSPQGRKLFVFDRVFGPEIEQAGIWEYLDDCVNTFIQGYNVSVLAYGQSGAGKSYTMGTSGPLEQDDLHNMGVIPRAATALFEKLTGGVGAGAPANGPNHKVNRSSMSHLRTPARYAPSAGQPQGEKNWTLRASYVEIYNEQLRDLLIPEDVPQWERSNVTIREDVKGNIILTGLHQVEVNSVEDLMNVLNQGSTLRQTDATAINARSSRSHAVFSLNLVLKKGGKPQSTTPAERRFSMPVEGLTGGETVVTTDSKMHFVDLAGSERLKNTGAQGERAREGIAINGGLAALGKVISQLSSRQAGSHVSYRDSKLTRLLQDSLGGNAITYMIACVTQAEFHLSETLNTVQYAQRARAIQSKPRIQQVEEGDKQAIIDRLKAEVAFLREQIRSAERSGGERRTLAPGERSERQNEREAELQNQLLDAQENYTALSQRHAKLISELAKARDNEFAELEKGLGDSATERLNRSNSFAQAVEQVVLEYEKTIQTLEHSLSSTRATLSTTETSLLEKETNIAYTETLNAQLQARLQKLMDREASTEHYLHDLEAKLDGHTSGEEKNATIVMELRKEIARVRENEASAEDYISTLEERLAEADQDAELMQREIDRLEQVIERQRSLGKLDSLLYELDNIQQDAPVPEVESGITNGAGHRRTASRSIADHSRSQSHVSRHSHLEETIHESGEEDIPEETAVSADNKKRAREATHRPSQLHLTENGDNFDYPTSPAQSKFVADKLETMNQELLGLREDHEATLHDYELLNAKYEEALRAIAQLQDVVDETRHPARQQRDSTLSVASPMLTRPTSFLSDARTNETKDTTHLSMRSLSSELSSALASPSTTMDASEAGTVVPKTEFNVPALSGPISDDDLASEVHKLRSYAAEKEAAERALYEQYAQLEERHQETLDIVEELKTEVAKAHAANSDESSAKGAGHVIRRKSSQNVMVIDRAHRPFALLRNMAAEYFEDKPDVMEQFEAHLNGVLHELHARAERIQELETNVNTTKKEMETKMTIISGLTRERSSMKAASPIDMAVLRGQLEQSEARIKELQEAHLVQEKELESQLAAVKELLLEASTSGLSDAAAAAAAKAAAEESAAQLESRDKKIADLEAELAGWEDRHRSALESLQESEDQLKRTIEGLEAQLASVMAQLARVEQGRPADERALTDALKESETKHQKLIEFLRGEIDDYKDLVHSSQSKVAAAEQQQLASKKLLEIATKDRDQATAEAAAQKALIAKLEAQIAGHEQTIKAHQDSLHELQSSHYQDVDNIMSSSKSDYDVKLETLKSDHSAKVKQLEGDLTEAREELMKVATHVAYALGLDVSVEKIGERVEELAAAQNALVQEQQRRAELERTVVELSGINDTIMLDLETVRASLSEVLAAETAKAAGPLVIKDQVALVKKKVVDLESKNKKSSQIVEELEEQLQSNYDQVQLASNRLSTLQTERSKQLEEATAAQVRLQSELDTIKEEYASLQAKYESLLDPNGAPQRSNSQQGTAVRKSPSVTSLPSPPPAIPLPPLPNGTSNNPGTTSPTPRPPSKDIGGISQIQEDQEARIRLIEKHLKAEKQLTATLEEALTDLERQQHAIKAESEAWKRRAVELETEIRELKEKPQQDNRWSLQQVEEERKKRRDAEIARAHLEERFNTINNSKKKKKGSLNCF